MCVCGCVCVCSDPGVVAGLCGSPRAVEAREDEGEQEEDEEEEDMNFLILQSWKPWGAFLLHSQSLDISMMSNAIKGMLEC